MGIYLSACILSNKYFCLYVCELIQAFRQRAEWRDVECLNPVSLFQLVV